MGWGGAGPLGAVPGENDYGVFHAGENEVMEIENNMLIYSFDEQIEGALPLEAIAFDGDDGGPAFIDVGGELQIAGVGSNGGCCNFGDYGEYTRLGDIAYNWIEANIANSIVGDGFSNSSEECDAYENNAEFSEDYGEDDFDEVNSEDEDYYLEDIFAAYDDNSDEWMEWWELSELLNH